MVGLQPLAVDPGQVEYAAVCGLRGLQVEGRVGHAAGIVPLAAELPETARPVSSFDGDDEPVVIPTRTPIPSLVPVERTEIGGTDQAVEPIRQLLLDHDLHAVGVGPSHILQPLVVRVESVVVDLVQDEQAGLL